MMNSWKASLVISCCSPGRCLLGRAGKQERVLNQACVQLHVLGAGGSALCSFLVLVPGKLKQTRAVRVRPLLTEGCVL